MSKIPENQFNSMYHTFKTIKYNRLYLLFKHIYRFSPFLIFLWFLIPNYWIIGGTIIFVFLTTWIISMKMKSQRDINFYAADHFRKEYFSETFR
jgi:hypothetical protein